MEVRHLSQLRILIPSIQCHHFLPRPTCKVFLSWASLVAQMVNNLPAMPETQVCSLAQEDSLEKGMTIHTNILTWRISWRKESGRLQSMGSQRVGHNWVTKHSTAQQLCIYVNPNLPIHPTPFPHLGSIVSSLHLCLYFLFANKFICTIFLGCTCKC